MKTIEQWRQAVADGQTELGWEEWQNRPYYIVCEFKTTVFAYVNAETGKVEHVIGDDGMPLTPVDYHYADRDLTHGDFVHDDADKDMALHNCRTQVWPQWEWGW